MSGAASAALPPRGARAHFEAELGAGRFVVQRCGDCDQAVFYPRQACPHCGGIDLAWFEPAGRGTVYATTTVRLDPKAPHEVCLIDLDEGVRLMSTVRNVAPGAVRIGQRVRAAVEIAVDAPPRLVFDAVEAAR